MTACTHRLWGEPDGLACIMPGCVRPADHKNRAQQPTCHQHQPVVVSGSYVADRHGEEVNE